MSLQLDRPLVLLGAGKMGGAMLEGWLKGGADPPDRSWRSIPPRRPK